MQLSAFLLQIIKMTKGAKTIAGPNFIKPF
jgi:hypothetical protein